MNTNYQLRIICKKLLLTGVFLLLIFASANAQDKRLNKGNSLYSEGKFEEAIQVYEDILKTGVESEVLYFNLGNAYYKTANLPRAILNYERAKLIDSDDLDVNYNLDLAYSQTIDKIEPIDKLFIKRWIQDLIDKGTSDFWAYTSIALFLIVLILSGIYLYSGNATVKRVSFFSSVLLVVGVILSFNFASVQSNKLSNRTEAIIFEPSVTVKSSPDFSGTDLFVIHEGTKVKILETVGNWKRVQVNNGSQGWLVSQSFIAI